MYSYGICLWQLLTREKPYGNCNLYVVIFGVVSYSLRPEVSEELEHKNEAYVRLFTRLWKAEPSDRPCPKEVIIKLCQIKMNKISSYNSSVSGDTLRQRWKLWCKLLLWCPCVSVPPIKKEKKSNFWYLFQHWSNFEIIIIILYLTLVNIYQLYQRNISSRSELI